jgi:protein involved in polysaccharide export with SLBB domain
MVVGLKKMKSLSILFALACLILIGCITRTTPTDDFAVKAEPNVIKVLILGSVKFPGMHNQKAGDSLARIPLGTPLHEVISVGAGGFTELAYKKGVRINRYFKSGSDRKTERIFLDFTQPDDRKVEKVLRDGDIIYVSEIWNLEVETKPRPFNPK